VSWWWDSSSSSSISYFCLTKISSQLFHQQFYFTLHGRTSGIVQLLLLFLRVALFQFVAASAPAGSHVVQGICRKNNSMALASG
jgi:hypothetical protein